MERLGDYGWQLHGNSAELYERYLVPTVTLPWARDLVERVGLRPGDRVLDVACGTGVVARLAATAVGAGGSVAAVDVNREMLAVGRSVSPPDGAGIEWYEASAEALPFGEAEFAVVLCQLGLQFFPDRLGALREIRRVLVEIGRFGASVYTSIEENPAAYALVAAVDRRFGAGASRAKRSEHSLADPEELRDLFDVAGFGGVRIETVTQNVRFASVDEWIRIQFAATPLAALVGQKDPTRVDLVCADVSEALAAFAQGDAFVFPQQVHVALGTSA